MTVDNAAGRTSRVEVSNGRLRLIDSLLREKMAARDQCDFEKEAELKIEIERVKQEAGIGEMD